MEESIKDVQKSRQRCAVFNFINEWIINQCNFFSSSSHDPVPVKEDRFIKSATGGFIPGPPISRRGSSRSDIPWHGVEGDDIDPRQLYRNHSRMSMSRQASQSLSPASSTLSSSMSSFIIDDPTSASSVTTLKTPTEVRKYFSQNILLKTISVWASDAAGVQWDHLHQPGAVSS